MQTAGDTSTLVTSFTMGPIVSTGQTRISKCSRTASLNFPTIRATKFMLVLHVGRACGQSKADDRYFRSADLKGEVILPPASPRAFIDAYHMQLGVLQTRSTAAARMRSTANLCCRAQSSNTPDKRHGGLSR